MSKKLYDKVKALYEDHAATSGEKANARAAMDRMEAANPEWFIKPSQHANESWHKPASQWTTQAKAWSYTDEYKPSKAYEEAQKGFEKAQKVYEERQRYYAHNFNFEYESSGFKPIEEEEIPEAEMRFYTDPHSFERTSDELTEEEMESYIRWIKKPKAKPTSPEQAYW